MFKSIKKTGAFLLAVAMVLSLGGCKKSSDNDNSSVDVEYVYDYEYVTQNGDKVSGDNGGSAQNATGNSNSQTSGKVDAEKYRGTTVRYATWRDPDLNEDGPVVKKFEKEYGINVEIDFVAQKDYNNSITSMVAAGNSPDVYFCNMFWPYALSNLQPIDAMQLDLSDPIWDKELLDFFTVNGKTYLVGTVGNIWNCVDNIFFNKTVLKQAGFTEEQFPDKLYEKGVWTWDALETIMSTVKTKLGSQGYKPAFLAYDTILGSTGCNLYTYKNGKFSANLSDPFLLQVNERLADWWTKGYLVGYDTVARDEFLSGKVAIAATNNFGLKRTGYWQKMNQDNIGFTYMPDYDKNHKAVPVGLTIGWGLIKGAKNPVGAGLFLRYYHDVNNYDLSGAFISDAAATFNNKLTTGSMADINLITQWNDYGIAMRQPSQIKSKLDEKQNTVAEECKNLNDIIAQNTK